MLPDAGHPSARGARRCMPRAWHRERGAQRRRALLPTLAALVLLVLAGCNEERWYWHQRLTLVVNTPAGPKAASSVVACEATRRYGALWLPEARGMGDGRACQGEAVVLEVAPGRYLFALLGDPSAFRVFFPGASKEKVVAKLVKLRETREVPRRFYPVLVTFGDVSDPKTVMQVDPQDLAASFGPGVSLSAVTLEITEAPVTEGVVEGVLGWWCDYRTRQARLNDSTSIVVSSNELPDVLGAGAFRVGDCK